MFDQCEAPLLSDHGTCAQRIASHGSKWVAAWMAVACGKAGTVDAKQMRLKSYLSCLHLSEHRGLAKRHTYLEGTEA
eukprot:Skav214035  [mRNA]  locus=scaffold198:71140:71749:+ [translate_table: standard]